MTKLAFFSLLIVTIAHAAIDPKAELKNLTEAKHWGNFNEQVLLATVPITSRVPDGVEVGTGFIVQVPTSVPQRFMYLLVTSAHVLEGKRISTSLTLHNRGKLPSGEPDIENSITVPVPANRKIYRHKGADLACLVISDLMAINLSGMAIPLNMFADFHEDGLVPGLEVWFAGYPADYYDKLHNLPLLRHGYIASYPRVDFPHPDEKNVLKPSPMFVVDAQLVAGSSGSPVFAPFGPNGSGLKFIGVAVEDVNPPSIAITSTDFPKPIVIRKQIGLGNVIKSTAVRELIDAVIADTKTDISKELVGLANPQ